MKKENIALYVERKMTFSCAFLLGKDRKYMHDWYEGDFETIEGALRDLQVFWKNEKEEMTTNFILYCGIVDKLYPRQAF